MSTKVRVETPDWTLKLTLPNLLLGLRVHSIICWEDLKVESLTDPQRSGILPCITSSPQLSRRSDRDLFSESDGQDRAMVEAKTSSLPTFYTGGPDYGSQI